MRSMSFRGSQVAYLERGSGPGPGVLFLHNGGTSSTIWREQLEAVGRTRRAIAIDLPGFGRSPRPTRPLRLDDLVELAAQVIETEDLAPALVVGNCMGSNIAGLLARRHRSLVAALVLVNPLTEATFAAGHLGVLHRMGTSFPRTSATARWASRRIVLPGFAATLSLRWQVGRAGAARGVHRDPELVSCARRRDQLPALVDVLDDMDSYGHLDRIDEPGDVPTCVVWGAENRVLAFGAGKELNQRLDPERAEVLVGCGHLPMLEAPDEVSRIINEFADRHLPAATAAASPSER